MCNSRLSRLPWKLHATVFTRQSNCKNLISTSFCWVVYTHMTLFCVTLFFFNIPEKCCISGKHLPSLSIHMGSAGVLGPFFPGFGLVSETDWRRMVRFQPMILLGDRPLHSNTHNSGWTNAVVRVGIGCVAFMATTVAAQAQTYYYYPTSGTPAPAVTAGSNVAPTYSYRRGLFGRVIWTGYSPQSYQTTYTPQYYQTVNSPQVAQQTEAAQTPAATQVIPASYPSNAIAGSAATATEATTPPAATEATAPVVTGDPYGFIGWLNSTNWAAENNNQQAARGMGHFVMGPARRQNAAIGSISNIGSMWMNSPAHRAALLDPTIRWIGIAGLGAYWTFNAN
jgi:hypothetical protein